MCSLTADRKTVKEHYVRFRYCGLFSSLRATAVEIEGYADVHGPDRGGVLDEVGSCRIYLGSDRTLVVGHGREHSLELPVQIKSCKKIQSADACCYCSVSVIDIFVEHLVTDSHERTGFQDAAVVYCIAIVKIHAHASDPAASIRSHAFLRQYV